MIVAHVKIKVDGFKIVEWQFLHCFFSPLEGEEGAVSRRVGGEVGGCKGWLISDAMQCITGFFPLALQF
jgi:hypothetical protein